MASLASVLREVLDDDAAYAPLLTAGHLYYEDDLSQQQIADRLGVSRSTVSRLLQLAREQGIVRIEIRPPSSASQLCAQLQSALATCAAPRSCPRRRAAPGCRSSSPPRSRSWAA
jgi:predicted transcriptional regulator